MLCNTCINSYQREYLKDAYLEHINRGACRRIFPPSIVSTCMIIFEPHYEKENLSLGFTTKYNTNLAVPPQKIAKGFEISDLGSRGIVLSM